MFSKFGKLNIEDLAKGIVVAALGAVIPVIESVISTGSLSFDWKAMGYTALTAAVAYLTKNLFTNSNGLLFTKEKNN